ncbi:hypothetical protein [Methylobacterium sp. Leaf399]|uniref:hypothetical protein n=1 Tax=Methylobacterium sp. Leaf399 TaxID=1736364 RepID=UPI0012E3A4CF|nr:hypothetical protein [Methylobacterium sp. Leaf399]
MRDRIGMIALDMVFQGFLSGNAFAPEDRVIHSDEERGEADAREGERLNSLYRTIEDALPDLFGPPGENPAWALPIVEPGSVASRADTRMTT